MSGILPHALDLLSSLGEVRARAMMGGHLQSSVRRASAPAGARPAPRLPRRAPQRKR